jgi:hypothetical protein
MLCWSLFVLFLLAIVLSVRLQYTDSDCPFGIFKLILLILQSNLHLMIVFFFVQRFLYRHEMNCLQFHRYLKPMNIQANTNVNFYCSRTQSSLSLLVTATGIYVFVTSYLQRWGVLQTVQVINEVYLLTLKWKQNNTVLKNNRKTETKSLKIPKG